MTLDYRFAPIDIDIIDHDRVLDIGKRWRLGAFGLWAWGQCYAKKHSPKGILRRSAVLAAMAAPEKEIEKLVAELVRVGLWLDVDGAYPIHNWEKKGPGKKSSSTERMRRHRERQRDGVTPGDASHVTDSDVTPPPSHVTSCSISVSSSPSSGSLESRSGDPRLSPRAIDGPPEWFMGAIATAEQSEGDIDAHASRWRSYVASRKRKGWAMNHEDAVGWLCDVMRGERDRRVKGGVKRGAEITKQPYEPDAPWLKLPGSA